jgi:hypothetical protein
VIEKDGSVSTIVVKEGIGWGCDEEVVRVVEEFGPWIPAILDGFYVRMEFLLPVSFKLQ